MSSFDHRITSLKSDIDACNADLLHHISSLYKGTTSTINFKNDPQNLLRVLKQEVLELLKEEHDRSDYTAANASAIDECSSLVSRMESICLVSRKISDCDDMISSSDINGTSMSLREMQESLSQLPSVNSEEGAGVTCSLLRREARLLHSRFYSRLRRLVHECISVKHGAVTVQKSLHGLIRGEDTAPASPILLSDIWNNLLLSSDANEVISSITTSLWQHVLVPVWKLKKAIMPRVVTHKDSTELILDGMHDTQKETTSLSSYACRLPIHQMLEMLSHVLGYMYTDVFCTNAKVISISSATLHASPIRLYHAIEETCTSQLPKLERDVETFQKNVQQCMAEFDQKIELFGFATTDSGNAISLKEYAQSLPTKYAEARRVEYLSRARNLVLSDYHNTMLGTGDAQEDDPATAGDIGDAQALLDKSGSFCISALHFESCQISLAACRLLKLIHEIMKQIVSGDYSYRVSALLYRSARDCLDIFCAVVPAKFDGISTMPRLGAIFYNDCSYIAHNCTLITHTYRQDMVRLFPAFEDTVGFIDYIPKLRTLGEKCLQDHVEEQKQSLSSIMHRIRIQTHTDDDEHVAVASADPSNDEENAIVLVKHLERLQGQWQSVLQSSVYERLMGYLMESIIRQAMKPVLEADFISETSGADISRIFKLLQKSRFVLPETTDENIGKYVGSWTKFCALADLLEYSLSDIAEWLPRKKFGAFTGQEMCSLVKALFDDSSRRQALLTSIIEHSS